MQPYRIIIPPPNGCYAVNLETPHLKDAQRLFEICQDPEVQRWTTVPIPYRMEDAEEFITHVAPEGWASGSDAIWGIHVAVNPTDPMRLGGMIDLRSAKNDGLEVGFYLAPDMRGRGLMRRVVRTLLHEAFDPSGPFQATYIRWRALTGNHASAAVARSCGFTHIGRGNALHRGQQATVLIAEIKPEELSEPPSQHALSSWSTAFRLD